MNTMIWAGTEEGLTRFLAIQKQVDDAIGKRMSTVFSADNRNFSLAKPDLKLGAEWDDDGEDEDDLPDFRPGNRVISMQPSGVAIIKVWGTLVAEHQWWHDFFPRELTSYEAIQDALDIAAGNDDITTVVMDFDTGGGSIKGMFNCADAIKELRKTKEVSAFTGTYAFSAGYALMCACNPITASRTAQVGSIGVIMTHTTQKRMLDDIGIDATVFRSGKEKALGQPTEELSEDAKAHFESEVKKADELFTGLVSENRQVSLASRSRWAEGKTFYAGEALDERLVDGINTFKGHVKAQNTAYYLQNAQNTGLNATTGTDMPIPQSKLDQIKAGVAPADALTPDELEEYKAMVKGMDDETPSDDKPDTKADTKPADETQPDQPAETTETTASGFSMAEIRALMVENGSLTAKLSAAEAQTVKDAEKLAALQAEVDSLVTVAGEAVNNLQTALMEPKHLEATTSGLLTQYNSLKAIQAKRFARGQQTAKANTPTEGGKPVLRDRLDLAASELDKEK